MHAVIGADHPACDALSNRWNGAVAWRSVARSLFTLAPND
jgi:hypothetical protein